MHYRLSAFFEDFEKVDVMYSFELSKFNDLN